jgi:hypothetical protein
LINELHQNEKLVGHPWPTPVILAAQKAVIRKIGFQVNLGSYPGNTQYKKRLLEWLKW